MLICGQQGHVQQGGAGESGMWWLIGTFLCGAVMGATVMFIFIAERLSFWVESYERAKVYEVRRDDWARSEHRNNYRSEL
jgi:hypothetical protein